MKPIGHATLLQKSKDLWAPYPVEIVWMNDATDWTFVSSWHSASSAADAASLRDSLEYATLAGKRWRYLDVLGLAPASLAELQQRTEKQPTGEFGLAPGLREKTPSGSILGFAFARHTWANSLMLEFLAGSPVPGSRIKGTGAALMQALALIALSLHCGELWGECTEASQGFYTTLKKRITRVKHRRQSGRSIRDRFQFTADEMKALLAPNRVKIEGCTDYGPGAS